MERSLDRESTLTSNPLFRNCIKERPMTKKLDQLTSLRFFAAGMIVLHHSASTFHLSDANGRPTVFGAGVSFFFVLSGFILAYVYPTLDSRPKIYHFLQARLARIWPVHAATFLLAWWLLSLEWETTQALANLALVHAWIPVQSYYFSYNAPSWSISTEAFFYLTFPFLIYRWPQTWRQKLLASGFLLVGLMVYCAASSAPDYTAWLYINPLSRLFEFLVGASIALGYNCTKKTIKWPLGLATSIELFALFLCGLGLYLKFLYSDWLAGMPLGAGFAQWFDGSGLFLCFGFLIYIVALGRGFLSQLLVVPELVLLGEISFSIYLVHQILIRFYSTLLPYLPSTSGVLAFGAFWIVVILSAYILWVIVEIPMRQIIMQPNKISEMGSFLWAKDAKRSPWRVALSALLLACIVAPLYPAITEHRNSRLAYDLAKGAAKGMTTIVVRALRRGADPNAIGEDGSTPLIHAVWNGHLEVVRVLIESGADPSQLGKSGLSPIEMALEGSHLGIVDYLVGRGQQFATERVEEAAGRGLILAIERDDVSTVVRVLDWGINPNFLDSSGSTPLVHAAWRGREAVVRSLLAKGADPNGKNGSGATALMAAFQQGHFDVFELLLSKGADPDLQRVDGSTVLMDAVWRQNVPVVTMLVSYGADPKLIDRKGDSALGLARKLENIQMLRLLSPR